MANTECNLTKRVRLTHNGKSTTRFCPVVLIHSNNNRVTGDIVKVTLCEEKHNHISACYAEGKYKEERKPGTFYLDWYEGSERRRKSVGKNPQDAANELNKRKSILQTQSLGVTVVDGSQNGNGRGTFLTDAVQDFLSEKSAQRKPKTHVDYVTALDYFQKSCTKKRLEDITRKDLLAFAVYCRDDLELAERTVFNKFARVVAFLKANKIKVHETGDAPKFVEEEPEIYEKDDLKQFFNACDEEEKIWFDFFLMTGMREQEVTHTYWKDIKFADSVVRVSHKPDLGWIPKAYKEREIPVPAKLMQSLKKLQENSKKSCPLVFPTSGCKPKLDFLDCCKAVARRAGLNCGQCDGCKGKANWCEHWFLHKFRATFATWHLGAGVDLRTVQFWLGHSDMESTMRYLKPSRSEQTRAKVNETFAAV